MVPLAHDAHISTYIDPLIGLVAHPIVVWLLLFVSPLELLQLFQLKFAFIFLGIARMWTGFDPCSGKVPYVMSPCFTV
jgi:hypothetical protein